MTSKPLLLCVAVLLSLTACKKETSEEVAVDTQPEATAEASSEAVARPSAAAAAAATETELSEEEHNRAEQQAKLDYATMEDGYINDSKGQWASTARASSSFGSANDEPADSQTSNTPWHAVGAPNGRAWTNNSQDIGFDWLEVTYDSPAKATEVRVVTPTGEAAQSLNKVELIDTDGKSHVAWSGLSDTNKDERGSRTWIVRKFDPTPYAVKSVKVTFANNVARGYKEVDAVQLISE